MNKPLATFAAFFVMLGSAFFLPGCGNATTTTSPTPQTNTPSATGAPTGTTRANATYSLADIAKHATRNDCWMAINGGVYDVTSFIRSGQHNPQIIQGCGIDATALFESQPKHSGRQAQSLLQDFYIGKLN